MQLIRLAVALVSLVAAVTAPPAAADGADSKAPEHAYALSAYLHAAVPFVEDARIERLRSLAPLLSETTSVQVSPHAPEHWFATTELAFPGLKLTVLEFDGRATVGIVAVEIASADWPLAGGLAVGASADAAVELLGPPHALGESTFTYYAGGVTLTVTVDGMAISALSLYYHWC